MDVHLLDSDARLDEIAPILLQLRPHYSLGELIAQVKTQIAQGYHLVYVTSGKQILCVAGFVIRQKLAWGKHIYIDDLVADESSRSVGAGALLMRWFRDFAQRNGCRQIHLDSGEQKFAAHRFYLRERFAIASHHFSMTDISC